jgi:LTXXQ motif family protein
MKTMIISTVTALALTVTAWAQAPDPHHPEGAAPGAAQPAPQPPAGMGGMAEMMKMMQSMHATMMGPDMAGMGTIDRIEGRIAFLRAELKITDAQANAWNAFADALRANAQKLTAARLAMMPASGAQQTLTERLDTQERWLTARLEGLRSIKAAFTPLFGTFSEEQKKTATEILSPHLGLAMMSGPMMPGMGPGQMGNGRMPPR